MSKGKQSTNISLKEKIKVDHCTLLIQRNLIFYRGKSDPIIKFHKLKSTSTKIQSIFSTCVHLNRHIDGGAFEIYACQDLVLALWFVRWKNPYSFAILFFSFYFFTLPGFLSVVTEIRVDGPSPCKGVYYRPGKRCLRCSKRTMLQEFEVGQLKEDAASRCSLSQIACNNCFFFVKSLRDLSSNFLFFSLSLSFIFDEIVIISMELQIDYDNLNILYILYLILILFFVVKFSSFWFIVFIQFINV